jgi:hypothetical protein
MSDFTDKDIKNKRKYAELMIEAAKDSEIISRRYKKMLITEGEPIEVYHTEDMNGYKGTGHLYLNRWLYQDNLHPTFSWSIETSEEGLFESMKYAYLCETSQIMGDWDVPMRYFREWIEHLQ